MSDKQDKTGGATDVKDASTATLEPGTKDGDVDKTAKVKDWDAVTRAIDAIADTDEQRSAFERLVNAEADRRTGKGIEAARAKWDEENAADLEKAKEEAEKQHLAEQGKYQELAETAQAKLDVLEADKKRAEFLDAARATLREPDINAPELEDVLLKPLNTIESVKEAAAKVRGIVNKLVETEVNRRLETGDRPRGNGGFGAPKGPAKDWALSDKTAYIEEHGEDAYTNLLYAQAKPTATT